MIDRSREKITYLDWQHQLFWWRHLWVERIGRMSWRMPPSSSQLCRCAAELDPSLVEIFCMIGQHRKSREGASPITKTSNLPKICNTNCQSGLSGSNFGYKTFDWELAISVKFDLMYVYTLHYAFSPDSHNQNSSAAIKYNRFPKLKLLQ